MEEVMKIVGVEVQEGMGKNDKPYTKYNYTMKKSDGKLLKYVGTFDTPETVMMNVVVIVEYTEKPNPNKPEYPYLNITSMTKATVEQDAAFYGDTPVIMATPTKSLLGSVSEPTQTQPTQVAPNEGESAIMSMLKGQLAMPNGLVEGAGADELNEASFVATMKEGAQCNDERAAQLWVVFKNK